MQRNREPEVAAWVAIAIGNAEAAARTSEDLTQWRRPSAVPAISAARRPARRSSTPPSSSWAASTSWSTTRPTRWPKMGGIADITTEQFDQVMKTNLYAHVLAVQEGDSAHGGGRHDHQHLLGAGGQAVAGTARLPHHQSRQPQLHQGPRAGELERTRQPVYCLQPGDGVHRVAAYVADHVVPLKDLAQGAAWRSSSCLSWQR